MMDCEERQLRPNRRTSYKSFFKAKDEEPLEDTGSDEKKQLLLPTPVSIEDSIAKTGFSTGIPVGKRGSLITPQSLQEETSLVTSKKRCKTVSSTHLSKETSFVVPPRRQNPVLISKSYLETLDYRIKIRAMRCSWSKRKDQLIEMANSELPFDVLNLSQRLKRTVESFHIPGRNEKLCQLLGDTATFHCDASLIKEAQKGRMIDREELIHSAILPIVNNFGMHHETLFIAVNMFDRFLSKVFLHKKAQYRLAAMASAFIAVKYNEEFDPEVKTIMALVNENEFIKKDLLAMERKVMHALDWQVRPITPHVIAYKMLDDIQGFIPSGVKRYLVNITERIVLASLCSTKLFAYDWSLPKYTIRALMFALELVSPQLASLSLHELVAAIGGRLEATDLLTDEACLVLANFPIVYGNPIELGKYANP